MVKSKSTYRIKLLSGNNVVMVEATGYEAEIFTPQILNGRISFQNIIPGRRCCNMVKSSAAKNLINNQSGGDVIATSERNVLMPTNSRQWRLCSGNDSHLPIATSTPTALTKIQSTALTKIQSTAMAKIQSTAMAKVQPTVLNKVQPTLLGKVQQTALAKVQPTVLDKVQPTVLGKVQQTALAKVQPTVLAKVQPTAQAKVQSNALARVQPATGKENIGCDRRQVVSSRNPPPQLATPEPVRSAPKLAVASPGARIIRLFRDQTPNTPKNVGRIVQNNKDIISKNNTSTTTNSGIGNNDTSKIGDVPSFQSPLSSNNQNEWSSNSIAEFQDQSTPDIPLENKKGKQTKSSQRLNTPGTVTKWRKCITPLRTYSRRQQHTLTSKSNAKRPLLNKSGARVRTLLNHNRDRHNIKVMPSYMVNPTQAVGSKFVVEVKKRKMVVDAKTAISPQSFKRQQIETDDLKSDSDYKLPRNRQEYEMAKHSAAFDLLTNSNRYNKISPKLNEQFRKACINKKSTTVPKYKKFCDLTPLEIGGKS